MFFLLENIYRLPRGLLPRDNLENPKKLTNFAYKVYYVGVVIVPRNLGSHSGVNRR